MGRFYARRDDGCLSIVSPYPLNPQILNSTLPHKLHDLLRRSRLPLFRFFFFLRHIIYYQVSNRVVDHDSRFVESLVDLLDQLALELEGPRRGRWLE